MLYVTPLRNALNTLEGALLESRNHPDNLLYRDATIQRFEYTYELAVKLLRRYLSQQAIHSELIDQMGFKDLIREGNRKGLLRGNVVVWDNFRNTRNMTSHTYQAPIATQVFEEIPAFIEEVNFLLQQLEQPNHD